MSFIVVQSLEMGTKTYDLIMAQHVVATAEHFYPNPENASLETAIFVDPFVVT